MISTYRDGRFLKTLRESLEAIQNGENIVIYPENSENGYLPEIEGFFEGFAALAQLCYKKGIDVSIYVTYFKKKEKQYIVDAPVLWSKLSKDNKERAEIVKGLLNRCNELGKMQFPASTEEDAEKETAAGEA